ncbi:hypothetical protein C9J22_20300 [Photobacterium phosphoreum]|nr:hypothetical protein C9J22_20300 [Photobacterium phosphoreum]
MDGSNNDAIRDAVVEHAKNAPIIDPINHKETKRNLLNDNLQYAERNIANIGGKDVTFSNMMVAEDGNFSAIITHKDEHGNDIERTVSYQMDGSNNDAIRDAVVEYAKNAPIIDPIDVIIDPIDGEKPVPSEGQKIVEGINEKVAELKETYTGEKGKSAKEITTAKLSAIYKTQAQTDSRQDASIQENKEAITFLNTEIDRLDNKMDGVMAGVHAVNNARPYLTAEGQTAIGAGVGFAGSNSAVAVGLAHAVSASWSVSATMNVTTGDESELSGGFGTQYTF